MSSPELLGYHFNNFSDFLANTLRVGTVLRVHHISTPPTRTTPIYASPPGKQEEFTTCESHFLAISQSHATSAEVDIAAIKRDEKAKADEHVLVFAIEVLVFTTNFLKTVFVSKADSSGFLTRPPHSTQSSSSIIQIVISAFLEWFISQNLASWTSETSDVIRHDPGLPSTENESTGNIKEASVPDPISRKRRLLLSLFARSQNQYLFPGSIDNANKHVLDDRQLIKWWCRVLNRLVEREWPVDGCTKTAVTPHVRAADVNVNVNANGSSGQAQYIASESTAASVNATATVTPQAYVIVPGCDRLETIRLFFPPSAKYSQPGATSRWHNSYPAQHLVDTDTSRSGSETADAVPIRCMIPRLPDDPKARYCEDLDQAGTDDQGRWRDIRSLQQFWETMEYRQECAAGRLVGFIWVAFDTSQLPSDAVYGAATVSDKSASDVQHGHAQPHKGHTAPLAAIDGNAAQSIPSESAPASVVLSVEQYNILADFLINHTDFAGIEVAKQSTKEWISKVKEMSGAPKFGVDIEGRGLAAPSASRQDPGMSAQPASASTGEKHARDEATAPRVNVLVGVRKKRKVEPEVRSNQSALTEGRSPIQHG